MDVKAKIKEARLLRQIATMTDPQDVQALAKAHAIEMEVKERLFELASLELDTE